MYMLFILQLIIPCFVAMTYHGTSGGAPCVFPFTYSGTTYHACTLANGHSTPWCADKNIYDGLWGYCMGKLGIILQVLPNFTVITL